MKQDHVWRRGFKLLLLFDSTLANSLIYEPGVNITLNSDASGESLSSYLAELFKDPRELFLQFLWGKKNNLSRRDREKGEELTWERSSGAQWTKTYEKHKIAQQPNRFSAEGFPLLLPQTVLPAV